MQSRDCAAYMNEELDALQLHSRDVNATRRDLCAARARGPARQDEVTRRIIDEQYSI